MSKTPFLWSFKDPSFQFRWGIWRRRFRHGGRTAHKTAEGQVATVQTKPGDTGADQTEQSLTSSGQAGSSQTLFPLQPAASPRDSDSGQGHQDGSHKDRERRGWRLVGRQRAAGDRPKTASDSQRPEWQCGEEKLWERSVVHYLYMLHVRSFSILLSHLFWFMTTHTFFFI